MDLVADMLFDRLQREHAATIAPSLIRPTLQRRAARLPGVGKATWVRGVDRVANRLWDYPRLASGLRRPLRLFHIVDHSYAQLVHRLPAGRTIVTCHDLDTFRSVLDPELEPRSALFRAMTRHILDGLRKAGHIACDSHATRDALVAKAGIASDRTTIVPNGPHPSCSPDAEPSADIDAARLLGPARGLRRPAARRQHDRAQADRRAAARVRLAAQRPPPPPAGARRGPVHRRAAGARARARPRRRDCRPADPRSVDARRRLSAVRAAADAVGARRVRPAGARGAGVRDAGRGERHGRRCARSAGTPPSTARSTTSRRGTAR